MKILSPFVFELQGINRQNLDSQIYENDYSFAIDGLSAAGLRVLLHPVNEGENSDTYDRILWSSKDPTNKNWQRAEVLYTYNKEHNMVKKCIHLNNFLIFINRLYSRELRKT